ncbi:MAG: hypothetical protein IH933_08010 [Euryarchaeota archaeon]|jgi:hypothetical protein|nr:hypothetical protein [Euryarchaeota archaeon]
MALMEDNGDEFEESKEKAEEAFDPISDPVALGAAASVAFSWFLFYVKGNKIQGLFVGLWAPTLLGAASYIKQMELAEKMDKGLSFR